MAFDMNPSDAILEEMARELGMDVDELKMKRFFKLIKATLPVYIMNLTRKTSPFGGEIESNYTEFALGNNDNVHAIITVPPGKRWFLFGGAILNGDDVNRACSVLLLNEDDKIIGAIFLSQTINAGVRAYYPNTVSSVLHIGHGAYPLPLAAGWQIDAYFAAGGASSGGTGALTAMVVEVDE